MPFIAENALLDLVKCLNCIIMAKWKKYMPMILIKDLVGLSCLYSFEPHSITTGDQDCMQIQGNQNYHWDNVEVTSNISSSVKLRKQHFYAHPVIFVLRQGL